VRWIILSILLVFTCATVLHGYRGRRLARSVVIGVTALGAAWLLAWLAIARDWRDADGYVDCWPSCSRLQDTVAVLFWVAPAAALLLVVSANVGFLIGRRRLSGRDAGAET
jgi:hypothetical protein